MTDNYPDLNIQKALIYLFITHMHLFFMVKIEEVDIKENFNVKKIKL